MDIEEDDPWSELPRELPLLDTSEPAKAPMGSDELPTCQDLQRMDEERGVEDKLEEYEPPDIEEDDPWNEPRELPLEVNQLVCTSPEFLTQHKNTRVDCKPPVVREIKTKECAGLKIGVLASKIGPRLQKKTSKIPTKKAKGDQPTIISKWSLKNPPARLDDKSPSKKITKPPTKLNITKPPTKPTKSRNMQSDKKFLKNTRKNSLDKNFDEFGSSGAH